MKSLRATVAALSVTALAFAGTSTAAATPTDQAARGGEAVDYVVLVADGASVDTAAAAAQAAGGTVTEQNTDVGVLTVTSSSPTFAQDVSADASVGGAARDTVIGQAPAEQRARKDVERVATERASARPGGATATATAGGDPLTSLQWDMAMIHAPEAHQVDMGSHRVKVGIMDTGVDGTHPDIAPNFDSALSRNFTTDIPAIDGPCEVPSCVDPANVDDDGHGTHVAGTIGSPRNGVGIEGVAPGVDLVNVRAGQDSGYFFLGPFVNAMTYAGQVGLDVVNMSFYIDPWLYNCAANPADSPEAQLEQRTIVRAAQRAIDFARRHGVTLVAALGNENTDLGNPTFDGTSPDYPPATSYDRTVDNSCIDVPTESNGVIATSALGPSGRKAYYSNWGTEQTDVSAPGGDFRDGFGTATYRTPGNLILAPYPEHLARESGDVDADGNPTTPFVVADCTSGTCSYYQYLQGTSMASPHAAGVAALVVSANGHAEGHGGFGLNPQRTEALLYATATKTPCPTPATLDYPDRGPEYTATCVGDASFNGFYGHGIVDALNAVGGRRHQGGGDDGSHGGGHDDGGQSQGSQGGKGSQGGGRNDHQSIRR